MKFALARLGAVGLVSLSAAELHARPSDFSVALDYSAPSGCPDAADLETVVRARLGYDPFASGAADHVQVRIIPRGAFLDGQIEWRDVTGKWAGDQKFRVASSECRGLTRTMALALAVQIQLLADATALPPESATNAPDEARTHPAADPPPPMPAPAPPTPKPAAKRPEPATMRDTLPRAEPAESDNAGARAVLTLGAGTGVALGMSSQPVVFGRAFGAVKGRELSLELGVELGAKTTTRRADGAGFSQQALLVTAAGCRALERWAMCLVARAGEVQMDGKDVDRPNSAAVAIVDGGVRIGFVQPLARRIFVGARAEGLVHFTRWTARLDDLPVWTAPRFAAALGVDVGVQLF